MSLGRTAPRLDLLRLPGLGRFARWRYARLTLQLPLLALALLAVFDGLIGRQVAPQNLATVSVWLHYRGLLVLALLVLGNLFCAACPLMLTRGPSRLLGRFLPRLSWPRALRNKFLVLGLTVAFLFAYELFDLWASPWLTAWLIVGYFGAALAVDSLFPAGTFCKYVCPLGNFNFALSHVSPAQITARDPDVCRSCAGQYCVNGRVEGAGGRGTLGGPSAPLLQLEPLPGAQTFPGCETTLFVPQMRSNQDCTLCLNCVRACPHDNVALAVRAPTRSWARWRPRADLALLGTVLLLGGVANAWAMVPGFRRAAQAVAALVHTRSEALVLLILLGGLLLGGTALTLAVFRLSSRLAGHPEGTRRAARRWGVVVFPLAFAIWAGHTSFHFLTGWASIVPVTQQALGRLGLFAGSPDWTLAALVPENLLFPLQVALLYAGYGASSYLAVRVARDGGAWWAAGPLLAWLTVLAVLTVLILGQPMELRGTLLDGGR
ncbi:4Fe-4S binding protein [Deinococcus planocerae]|uniref:4Fe-4S binding protein n=1 Tax=Deinococcus planocerae TaxID=1737569 RepID=UPI000C7F63B1|nr:4Fe-4S ferredoxin [Deinococcus planocerae]